MFTYINMYNVIEIGSRILGWVYMGLIINVFVRRNPARELWLSALGSLPSRWALGGIVERADCEGGCMRCL